MKVNTFIKVALVLVLPLLVATLFTSNIALALALFISIIILWFTEWLPLAVTGLLVPVLAVVYGQLDTSAAFSPFGNQILFLFIGSFILAKAMSKHKWDQRMAYFILSKRFASRSIESLCLNISLLCFILSMWISNTATCAILVPICVSLIDNLEDKFEDPKEHYKFKNRLLLTCAFSSSIGGLATPIGSPPNLLAMYFLEQVNIPMDFLGWMLRGLPISLIMLVALNMIFKIRLPIKKIKVDNMPDFFQKKYMELGKIKTTEIQVFFAFSIAVFLWITPSILKTFFPNNDLFVLIHKQLPMGVVALISAISLFIMTHKSEEGKIETNLNWKEASQIDWGTILLFGGGLCMGTILDKSGLANIFGSFIFQNSFLTSETILLVIVATLFAIIMSELSSNTASASIVIPILLASLAQGNSQLILPVVLATAFGASFGFMLPVSTPPNAIVFGTGRIELKEMISNGILFDIVGCLIICLYTFALISLPDFF